MSPTRYAVAATGTVLEQVKVPIFSDEEEPSMESNPRLAALLAMHLVSQVMGEAYVIANAALDSGDENLLFRNFIDLVR